MENETFVQSIKPINLDTVHKICSGQVVLSLAIAVKELVENALDAGATIIEVRLKNYGIDLIEVSDNGTGVTEDNFAALTLKYHTSKLSDYSDLLGFSSFGFRGEALSSLSALANLTVTTRHSTSQYATKLEYDNKGDIVRRTPCSRQVGTTVNLSNLFFSLPVRQKEFHRNAKREFNRMTQLLYAYCLISLGVKITCTNQTSSNSKSVVVITQGSSYRDNIASVFGAKQMETILELKPHYVSNVKDNIFKGLSLDAQEMDNNIKIEDVEIDLSEDSNESANDSTKLSQSSISQISPKSQGYKNENCPIEFTGFVSTCAHGHGRSSTDRQFYYINSRPCEPIKIMKLMNEIYRQFNPNQYPFVFLNVNLDRSSVDVNVTPDKRKVFLTMEKIILNVLKTSMLKLFEDIPRTLKVENSDGFSNASMPNLKQPRIFNSFIQKFANKSSNINVSSTEVVTNGTDLKRKSTTMLDFVSSKTMKTEKKYDIVCRDSISTNIKANTDEIYKDDNVNEVTEHTNIHEATEEIDINDDTKTNSFIDNENFATENKLHILIEDAPSKIDVISESEPKTETNNILDKQIMYLESTDNCPNTQIRKVDDIIDKTHIIKCKTKSLKSNASPLIQNINNMASKKVVTDKEDLGKQSRRCVTLKTSFEHVKALNDLYNKCQSKKDSLDRLRFRSQINPVFNKKCEEELSREISKTSFKEMVVVGQFNLGFIITHLNNDLFIIDQHATDEIYNFETLQKTTELTSQKLVIPQQLELTGVNEQILMDNLDIFKKNGFTFDINPEGPPMKRVKLLTLPMSKNWVFGKEDIEELLFMLRESPNENCRPSRVRAMFASRACRKSVMIGTALSKYDMKTLVNHMAEIDKPWNCPHGRPTIRHLVNLAMIHVKKD